MIKKFVVSAPFGMYFAYPGATSTLGTFTLHYRGGFWYRVWRCLRTLRYNRRTKAWSNKLGLPNPGIDALPVSNVGRIVSIHGFGTEEWLSLAKILRPRWDMEVVELNLSCPNVGHRHAVEDVLPAVEHLLEPIARTVVAKLPPVRWMDLAGPLYAAGVRHFHACNTLPSPGGGISGKPLKILSLWAVADLKQKWGSDVKVIGGGGITHPEDVEDYRRAGADHFAVGSVLLNPLNWRRVRRMIRENQ